SGARRFPSDARKRGRSPRDGRRPRAGAPGPGRTGRPKPSSPGRPPGVAGSSRVEPPPSLLQRPTPSVANELVAAPRSADPPRDRRLYAARGLLPLERNDRIRALLTVLPDED